MQVCLLCLALSMLRKLSWRSPGFKRTTYPTDSLLFFLQLINKEEELLEKEKSSFPLLQTLMVNKIPYEQLWVTAYEFSIKSEEWMNGKPSSKPVWPARRKVGTMGIHSGSSEITFALWIPGLWIRAVTVFFFLLFSDVITMGDEEPKIKRPISRFKSHQHPEPLPR